MSHVIAIDPGERVGWAHAAFDDHAIDVTGQGVSPLRDFAITLGERIHDYDVVIYETWRLRPDMARKMVGNDFQPSQLIGIIRYLGWITPGTKLVSQGPNIKTTATRTMPVLGWAERMEHSTEQHDQDALMHLWYWWWSKQMKGES